MKTKDLVKILTEADPTGETECCVGNQDICCANVEPAYYDGALQTVERDMNGVMRKAKFHRTGSKVQISLYDIEMVFMDQPDFPVEYDFGGEARKRYEDMISKWRNEAIEIIRKVDSDMIETNKKNFFKTKTGMYVPYDFEHYKKIKRIMACINVSKLIIGRWTKWIRKDEKNRVKPEPTPCSFFFKKGQKYSNWDNKGMYHYEERLVDAWNEIIFRLDKSFVQRWTDIYNEAKTLKKENQYIYRSVSDEDIDSVYSQIEPWYLKFVKVNKNECKSKKIKNKNEKEAEK